MPAHVIFQPAQGLTHAARAAIGNVARSEPIADAATGNLAAADGETAAVCNTGAAAVYVAHGTTPDATATTATAETSAQYFLGVNSGYHEVKVKAGDKFAVVAVA